MARRGKTKRKQTHWEFTMDQIGRELRNVYPAREKLPPPLRILAKQLDKFTTRHRNRRGTKRVEMLNRGAIVHTTKEQLTISLARARSPQLSNQCRTRKPLPLTRGRLVVLESLTVLLPPLFDRNQKTVR
jgi:hypothetical protein